MLWRSAYQNGPTEGFWPVCPIFPEHWGASKGTVLQSILTEDLLSGEILFPVSWTVVGIAGCRVMGEFFCCFGNIIPRAVSYSFSTGKERQCLGTNDYSLLLLSSSSPFM